ncbi:MAG: outer membrane beta-barrel protein [Bacteroidetes bacterium]|nr:outer membrane beta-barrel protein [Bacteroidota bacterium]
MLNQKDNDFDDLFRRASEKYPLRTDSADWNRMAAALDNPPPDVPEELVDERRRKRRFLWLFLLFPLVGGGYYFVRHGGGGTGSGVVAGGNNVVVSREVKSAERGVEGVGKVKSAGGEGAGETKEVSGGEVKSAGGEGTKKVSGGEEAGKIKSAGGDAVGKIVAKAAPLSGREVKAAPLSGGRYSDMEGALVTGKKKKNRKNSFDATSDASGAVGDKRVVDYRVDRVRMGRDYSLRVNVEAPEMEKDSAAPAKRKASPKKKFPYLYAGLIGAPDLSSVHFQKSDGVGTTFGVLLGYQFNKRWSVETGVYLDRKKYYTDAEYFDTKEISSRIQYNWDSKSFDGSCYMWEIPVNVRYNFTTGEKMKWFGTAGLSTYLMTRENYNYNYVWWNGPNSGTATKNWDLRSPSQYWFSIINLSAGFEQRLGKVGNLRIEPYLRIPVSGLGTGKLNILSSGLNIGITRRLW